MPLRWRSFVTGVAAAMLCAGLEPWCAAAEVAVAQAPPTGQAVPQTRRVAAQLADFTRRVAEYGALHKKLEDSLPKLPKDATPEQIDRNQRALAALMTASRAKARPGDIFTPPTQVYIRNLLKRIFANFDKRKLRETIEDENPVGVRVAVNSRYPDEVPLASMPAEVLQALPALPEELEYRFVGDTLILLDPHAHIVADVITGALPK